MFISSSHLHSFSEELMKLSNVLTEKAREEIAPKNFALSAKQSETGKPAYPIENKAHASNALARVKQFGDAKERAEVYKDVARKFPGLAAKSSVPAVRAKEKDSEMGEMGSAQLPSSFTAPPVAGSMKMAGMGKALGHMLGEESRVGSHLLNHGHAYDLAGLGVLAAPSALEVGEQVKARATGVPVKRKELGKSLAELGGLGVLAAPVAAQLAAGRH